MANPDNANFCNVCGAAVARVLPPARLAWNAPPRYPRVPMMRTAPAYIAVRPAKSVGVAIILAMFFGPLGMLYSTVPGALFMLFISFVLRFVSAGMAIFLTWPVCVIWAAVAAESHNRS
jgi:hypothetical protein